MNISENKKNIQLREKYYLTHCEFKEAVDELRLAYFDSIYQKVRKIEEKTKKNFLKIINKDLEKTLSEFEFFYDPSSILFTAKVKKMILPENIYDLEIILKNVPEENRMHSILEKSNKMYQNASENMNSQLFELGLYPSSRPCKNKKIEKFLEENNIVGFTAEYYKK